MDKQYGKVAVLMGGWSAEREVSLSSGMAVLNALLNQGVDAYKVDMGRDICQVLYNHQYDIVFNMVHGRGGEDGTIQAILDALKIPYTGCGVMPSSIAMNKLMTKRIWSGCQLTTPHYRILDDKTNLLSVIVELGLPLIVKPTLEGSSVGMSKVNKADELAAAYQLAKQYGQVFVEQWVVGEEFTATILGDKVLPLIRLEASNDFYDYDAKYSSNKTRYFCPTGLPEAAENALKKLAMDAFKAIGGSGWGRVDFMLDENDQPWLIEVNTVPGMTSHSLVPMSAKEYGLSFDELALAILNLAK